MAWYVTYNKALPEPMRAQFTGGYTPVILFFSTEVIFIYFCSLFFFSYMTYMRESIWMVPILLDFNHWLHLSDILKRATQIKTRCRVSLSNAICMDDIEGWGKRPLLACTKSAADWYKALHIIENLSSYAVRFICDLLWMCAVERSYPRPLAGRLFYRPRLRGLTYPPKCKRRKFGTI